MQILQGCMESLIFCVRKKQMINERETRRQKIADNVLDNTCNADNQS